ncbi:formate dehydrogenase major subunit [Anaerosolibacter carboniphilus]|uniref:Formate dehydrogenase major subunit n=3 Tax=Anaerosolibacter carboniphilus TaxID=1417629 RepID=A0A841KYF8_9FIRM|nr:formate dehydrogenase major subunit [Anaerosolibacter carboniphilus]
MVNITINGITFKADKELTILQAANQKGIDIPTFCYDRRLVPHAACRICVVEVEGLRNLATACSTPISEGMVIHTHSEKVIKARKNTLELLLSDHPLDCLTCEKSGECKLQTYCYEYDIKENIYEGKQHQFPIDASIPFFYRDQNKCILCGKCVRVCHELQGVGAIEQMERGFSTYVGTAFQMDLENSVCVSCGNCVSACPVGALLPKSKEKFRLWEVSKVKTTCSYCGVGCQMELLVKNNRVVGVQPVDGVPNEGMLCVKGKFAYSFVNHRDRLKTPLIKKDGRFVEASWDEAYTLITDKIVETKGKYGSDVFGALASARCTNEENYLMQKLFRAVIGTNNIDHCARL